MRNKPTAAPRRIEALTINGSICPACHKGTLKYARKEGRRTFFKCLSCWDILMVDPDESRNKMLRAYQ